MVLVFKHGKALILCERQDEEFSFTQRSNAYRMSERSFLFIHQGMVAYMTTLLALTPVSPLRMSMLTGRSADHQL